MQFFQYFIQEFQLICSSNGIKFNGKLLSIYLRALIADAPARALILNHRWHNSLSPCSKCKVTGQFRNRRMCFLNIFNDARTDDEYLQATDKSHHLPSNESALKYLAFPMITFVPFEYMHLICLGVVKKFISALVENKYAFKDITKSDIKAISSKLLTMKSYSPHEFARRPRPLEDFQHYKATEFRQLLLYTGPVVFHNILKGDAYQHFLLLHTACRAL